MMGPVLARWLAVGLATLVAGVALGATGLPSPTLFAALLVGLAFALAGGPPLVLGRRVTEVAQALVGAAIGASFDLDALAALGERWAGVAVVVAATLGVSLLAGLALAAVTGVDRPTALLGLVAGGASGIIAMSDELGADARLVAFMQYARVLIVVLTAPLIVALFLGGSDGGRGGRRRRGRRRLAGRPGLRGRRVRGRARPGPAAPAARRLRAAAHDRRRRAERHRRWPATRACPPSSRTSPSPSSASRSACASRRRRCARRAGCCPPSLAGIAGLIAACALLAVVLELMTGVTYADAYLATTPGGLYAVIATALDGGGADPAFVFAVQALRLLVMVLAAPFVVRLLVPARAPAPGYPP